VVTGVGLLIHIYFDRLHGGGDRYYRFYHLHEPVHVRHAAAGAGEQFPGHVCGWEGVGLCSYLLIGYYFEKKSAGDAGKKAFIVNRIGDGGFIIGMMFLFVTFGSLDFTEFFRRWASCRLRPVSVSSASSP